MERGNFTDYLKSQRELKKIPQRHLADLLGIDIPMYSRIERGERKAKRAQIVALGKFLNDDNLLKIWLADKIIETIAYEENPLEVLSIVEEKLIDYGAD